LLVAQINRSQVKFKSHSWWKVCDGMRSLDSIRFVPLVQAHLSATVSDCANTLVF